MRQKYTFTIINLKEVFVKLALLAAYSIIFKIKQL
jgi:hypothetical protein